MYDMYVLGMSNGQFYAGFASDLKKRVAEHKHGKVSTTKKYLPVSLIFMNAIFPSEMQNIENIC
ncbi:MAG: GIY-YIG nuclease family protein [Candidatus Sungbacteria bacterium]|uniref:GIY-YIG nuclease family protein n=1 Tax=Candidatus Sungiibacteriota bacterium TaxID=2750080 RepID=A0A9D6QY79_9BACT|nr:GIY-YIG nuclease family protein [Candidatus Sungbacteria bacterium]